MKSKDEENGLMQFCKVCKTLSNCVLQATFQHSLYNMASYLQLKGFKFVIKFLGVSKSDQEK